MRMTMCNSWIRIPTPRGRRMMRRRTDGGGGGDSSRAAGPPPLGGARWQRAGLRRGGRSGASGGVSAWGCGRAARLRAAARTGAREVVLVVVPGTTVRGWLFDGAPAVSGIGSTTRRKAHGACDVSRRLITVFYMHVCVCDVQPAYGILPSPLTSHTQHLLARNFSSHHPPFPPTPTPPPQHSALRPPHRPQARPLRRIRGGRRRRRLRPFRLRGRGR